MSSTSNLIQDLFFDKNVDTLVKPDISFGNYFLEWDEESLGIYSSEVLKLRTFVKNMIPNLEAMMRIINASMPKNDPLAKVVDDKGVFSISDRYNSQIFFILNIDAFGSTVLFREERMLINDETFEKLRLRYEAKDSVLFSKLKVINNVVSIKWKIGHLLFNRMEHNKK